MLQMKRRGIRFKIPIPPKPVSIDEDADLEGGEVAEPEVPKAVERGPELERILALPRRPIVDPDSEEAAALAAQLTERLRKVPVDQLFPGPLRPIQAMALREAWTAQGGFFPIGVGHGKMLLAALMFSVFARPGIYICRGDGKRDAELYFNKYRQSWKMPGAGAIRVMTYELLSNPSSAAQQTVSGHVVPGRLDRFKPQIIVADECHMLASSGSAVSRRLRDYLQEHPECIFVAMTGTPFKTSINDAAHVMDWALKENSPLPRTYKERMAWAGALDAQQGMLGAVEPGALEVFRPPGKPSWQSMTKAEARRAVGLRILETPGVVGTQEPPVDIPITVTSFQPDEECDTLNELFEQLRSTWALPDGTQISDPKAMARHEKNLSLGYWMRYDPEPPPEWRQARNTWAKFCRRALKHNKRKVYSESLLKAAIRKGQFQSGAMLLQNWEEQCEAERKRTGLREPNTECVWESEEMLEAVAGWLAQYPGLIWVEHIGLGEKLRDYFNIPYYGSGGGLDIKTNTNIRDHKGGPAIASFAACSVGKNLQGFWSNNLWLGIPPTEQAMARTHRPGQKASVVTNHVYLGCARHLESFELARNMRAAFASEITLSDQKLSFAHVEMPSLRELSERPGIRWSSKKLLDDEEEDV
jgi:hypothetical protein